MDAHDRSVRLSIPAKAEYITLSRLALTAIARVQPLSDETLSDLKLALTEACTNSVRHAYREGRRGQVEIVYQIEPDRLVVEVTDDGEGFEPSNLAGDGNGDLNEGGLGIAIIRAVADEVEIGVRESGGSRLRFVKFLGD
ncbi:MAG TPA: ATP-binding protein [Gaiellaceae bacterium]|jgi:serine/threonine-protein kinase RsbW|nr:ATP-binding protein [Gaiellaceae bacterium]